MNDQITVDKDDILTAAEQLTSMAGVYGDAVSIISGIADIDTDAFEDAVGSPDSSWAGFRDVFWGYLADTQDSLNRAALLVAQYAVDTYGTDSDTSDALNDAGDFDEATRP